MAVGKKREKIIEEKRKRKAERMKAGGESKYARKVRWCRANDTPAVEAPYPKPWNS
jgi:hypothetical protein